MRKWMNLIEQELTEINVINDLDDEAIAHRMATQYDDAIARAHRIGSLGDLTILKDTAEGFDNFYLMSADKKLVGRASVAETNGHHYVRHIWFDPTIRSQGNGYYFYLWLLQQGYQIISDWDQTEGAQRVWRKLAHDGFVRTFTDGEIGDVVHDIERFYSFYAHSSGRTRLIASAT